MSTLQIAQATTADVAEILALQKLAYRAEAELYQDWTIPPLTQTYDESLADFTSQLILKAVAEEPTDPLLPPGGHIVGSVRAYARAETCYIGRLMVHLSHQKQGLGTLLMHDIERRFSHVQRYELFTGAASERNIHLYEKLGYTLYKRQVVSPTLTLVYMEKRNTP